jgi:hypothetical protein
MVAQYAPIRPNVSEQAGARVTEEKRPYQPDEAVQGNDREAEHSSKSRKFRKEYRTHPDRQRTEDQQIASIGAGGFPTEGRKQADDRHRRRNEQMLDRPQIGLRQSTTHKDKRSREENTDAGKHYGDMTQEPLSIAIR